MRDSERWPLTEKGLSGAVVGIRGKHASLEQSELQGVAINQRKIVDHPLIFDFSEDGAGGVYLDDV